MTYAGGDPEDRTYLILESEYQAYNHETNYVGYA
jgi:hypothetical protein